MRTESSSLRTSLSWNEPELFNKSEQNRSDKARKTGKLLRHGEQIRQIVQTWRENQARWKRPWHHTGFKKVRHERPAWKVQRICICGTDSLTKSGKSTDSLMLLGKSYRFFEEIRRVKIGCAAPNFASLKTTSSLSKFAQTWREKPANSSDMVRFSGKSFRHGEKIRLHESVHKTNLEIRVTSRKVRLKSAKNLYLRYRF